MKYKSTKSTNKTQILFYLNKRENEQKNNNEMTGK